MSQARRSMTPGRPASHPALERRLDFSVVAEDIVAQSPLRTGARRGGQRKIYRDVYDLQEEEDEDEVDEAAPFRQDTQINEFQGSSPIHYQEDSLELVEDEAVDSGLGALSEDVEPVHISSPSNYRKPKRALRSSGDRSQLENATGPSKPTSRKPAAQAALRKRGSKPKGKLLSAKVAQTVNDSVVSEEPSVIEELIEEDETVNESAVKQAPPKKRGRPARAKKSDESALGEAAELFPAPKTRGRPPKATAQDDSQIEDEDLRPAKRANKGTKGALSERNPNAKMGPPVFKKPAIPQIPGSPGTRSSPSMWAGARAVSRLREGTPAVEAGTTTTRSGRTVLKPLQHWAGEKAQYARDGTIKEVQFSESVDLPTIRRGPLRGKKRSRSRLADDMETIEEEDSEPEPELWEVRCEKISAMVKVWDPILGAGRDDEEEEQSMYFTISNLR
jgi:hypothetical protein